MAKREFKKRKKYAKFLSPSKFSSKPFVIPYVTSYLGFLNSSKNFPVWPSPRGSIHCKKKKNKKKNKTHLTVRLGSLFIVLCSSWGNLCDVLCHFWLGPAADTGSVCCRIPRSFYVVKLTAANRFWLLVKVCPGWFSVQGSLLLAIKTRLIWFHRESGSWLLVLKELIYSTTLKLLV